MQALKTLEKQKDLLDFQHHPSIKKVLLPQEKIVFSGEVFKYFKEKKMKRKIFMTNMNFFTLGKKYLIGKMTIKRRIPYKNIQKILSAKKSDEILIETSSYEIRLASADKEGIIQHIVEGYWQQTNQDFPIYLIDDITLERLQQLKGDKRKEELKSTEIDMMNPKKIEEEMNQTNQLTAKIFESLVDLLPKIDFQGEMTRKLTMQKKIISEDDSSEEDDDQKDLIQKDEDADSEEFEVLGDHNLNVIMEQDEEQMDDSNNKKNSTPVSKRKKQTKIIQQQQLPVFEKLLRKLNIIEKEEKYYQISETINKHFTTVSLTHQIMNKSELNEIFQRNSKRLQRLEEIFKQEQIEKEKLVKEKEENQRKINEAKSSPIQNQYHKYESIEISQNFLETVQNEKQQFQEEQKQNSQQQNLEQIEEIPEHNNLELVQEEQIQITITPAQPSENQQKSSDNQYKPSEKPEKPLFLQELVKRQQTLQQHKIEELMQPQHQESSQQSTTDNNNSTGTTSSLIPQPSPQPPKLIILEESVNLEQQQLPEIKEQNSNDNNIPSAPKISIPLPGGIPPPPVLPGIKAPPPLSLLTAQNQKKQPKTIQFDWTKMPSVHQKEGIATVWQEQQQVTSVAIQFDDLEKQFAKKNITNSSNKAVAGSLSQGKVDSQLQSQQQQKNVCLLQDSKKAYNMNISLSAKFKKIPMDILKKALLDIDFSIVNTDIAETLSQFIPSFDEIQFFKNYQRQEQEGLDLASQFMLTICVIPRYPIRLRMIIFKSEFSERLKKLKKQSEIVETANTNVKSNLKFIGFLKIVLDLGNQMNQGTTIGKAKGFKIGSLQKLLDIKASAGSQTLFDYLMHKLYEQQPDILTFADDFSMLDDAVKIELQALIIDIQQFVNQFNQLKIAIESARKEDPIDSGFVNAFEPFQIEKADQVANISQKGKDIKENFTQVAKYFGEDNNTLKRLTFQDFYSQINGVCKQIKVFIQKEDAKIKRSKKF